MEDKDMEYTYKELKKMTVAQLREIAKDIEDDAVKGYTQLNKEHLLEGICKALNIDTFEHHIAIGLDKTNLKSKIKKLKQQRDEAIKSKDLVQLQSVRKNIKRFKKALRKAAT